jgi:hypothetical protein
MNHVVDFYSRNLKALAGSRARSELVSLVTRIAPVPYEPKTRFVAADLLEAGILGAIAAAIALYCLLRFDTALYDVTNMDRYFGADQPRVIGVMADRLSVWHYRDSVHPLFSLLIFPVASFFRLFGAAPTLTVGYGLVTTAGFFVGAMMLLAFRGLGMPRSVAALFSAVLLSSATYIHWFAIVETYPLSGVTIVAMLLVLTSARSQSTAVWLLASLGTISITVTNWSLALASGLFRLPLHRAIHPHLRDCGRVVSWTEANLPFGPALFHSRRGVLRGALDAAMEIGQG